MGFLKDFMDNIVKRVSLDAKFNDSGLCINVGLKDTPVNNDRVYYSVSMHGIDNPVGGVTLVMLSCPGNRLSAPLMEDEADRRLFINGLFRDTDSPHVNPILQELSHTGEGTVVFDSSNGFTYTLMYKYFDANDLDYSDEAITDEVILDYICTKLIPGRGNVTFVYDANLYGNRQNKLYDKIVDTCIEGSSDVFNMSNTNCTLLSDYMAEYHYNNVIEIFTSAYNEVAETKVADIPTTVEGQKKWIDALKKKCNKKELEYWKHVCKNTGEDGK